MDCWPAWFQVAFGLLLGFIIGVGIVTLVILAEVKKLVLWAKREVHLAKEELEWLRPWAEGVSRRIRRCNYKGDEGDFWGVNMADAQTQTRKWSGAMEYAGDIPRGAGRSVPTSATTLSSSGEEGDYVDMSGVHALRDVRCGGMDREATRSVLEQQKTMRYEGRKERGVLPLQGSGQGVEEKVARGAQPKMGACSIGHGTEGNKVKEGSEEGGELGRGQEETRRAGLMARKRELEEERGRIKARLDMLEEVKREALRRKEDRRKEESGREKVEELLGEYWDDTSRKTLVKRRIDTGDTALIRQRKEEVKEQVRKAQQEEEQCEEEEAKDQSEGKEE